MSIALAYPHDAVTRRVKINFLKHSGNLVSSFTIACIFKKMALPLYDVFNIILLHTHEHLYTYGIILHLKCFIILTRRRHSRHHDNGTNCHVLYLQ